MRIGIIIVTALLMAGFSFAHDELRHPAARKAVARAEQETRKAEQVYRQELLRIQRALIAELERAKADAMQRQLLEDANAIQAAIDAARGDENEPEVATPQLAGTSWLRVASTGSVASITFNADGTLDAPGTAWSRWESRGPALRVLGKGVRAFTLKPMLVYQQDDSGPAFILIPAGDPQQSARGR